MIRPDNLDLEQQMLVLLGRLRGLRDGAMLQARICRGSHMFSTSKHAMMQARFFNKQIVDQTRNIRRYCRLTEAKVKSAIDDVIRAHIERLGVRDFALEVGRGCSEQEAADLVAALVTSHEELMQLLSLGGDVEDELLPMIGMVLARRADGSVAQAMNANASLGAAIGRLVMRAADVVIQRELTDPRHLQAARRRAEVNAAAARAAQ